MRVLVYQVKSESGQADLAGGFEQIGLTIPPTVMAPADRVIRQQVSGEEQGERNKVKA